jgi:hypothetical protein
MDRRVEELMKNPALLEKLRNNPQLLNHVASDPKAVELQRKIMNQMLSKENEETPVPPRPEWSQMSINSKKTATDPVISQDAPLTAQLTDGVTCTVTQDLEFMLEEYIETANQPTDATGNVNFVDTQLLRRLDSASMIRSVVLDRNRNCIATLLSIPISIRSSGTKFPRKSGALADPLLEDDDEVIVLGCSTYLSVRPEWRKKNTAMIPIRAMIEYGYRGGVYGGYHITTHKLLESSIRFNIWFRPVDVKVAQAKGYKFPTVGVTSNGVNVVSNVVNKKTTKDRLAFHVTTRSKNVIQLNGIDDFSETARLWYREQMKTGKFVFWPNPEMWKRFCSAFHVYAQKNDQGQLFGVFALHKHTIFVDRKHLAPVTQVILFAALDKIGGLLGTPKQNLLSSIFACSKELGVCITYLAEIAQLTEVELKEAKAFKAASMYMSFYNLGLIPAPAEINVPLI